MATTTFTTMIPTPQPKKPGPPVPPRPQQSSLLKTQQRDASSSSSTSQRLMSKVGLEQPQILNKKPIITNASNSNTNTTTATSASTLDTSGGRTVIYKSPSLNLQKRQEEREKRTEASTQTTTSAITRTTSAAATAAAVSKPKLANGTQAPKPPLKLRKAPDVPTHLKPRITTPQPEVKENETKTNDNNNSNNSNSNNNPNNIVIVQSSQGVVTLNRHHSMGSGSPQNKPSALAKDTRLSLGKADFERVGKIQVQQLQPTSQPLPKPRKIVKVPVATLDVEDKISPSNTLHVNLFKRSKTSIENFTSRSNITTVNTNSTGSFLSGKTVEIKNNLKNAAERLFSEIMVNQQKQNALESNVAINTIITKHERAIQHQAAGLMKLNNSNNSSGVTVVNTAQEYATPKDNNCTRINITTITNTANNLNNGRQVVSAFNSPEKKSAAFHEMLISELAAMRTKSCSMENLYTTSQSPQTAKESSIDKQYQNYKQFKTLETQLKTTINNKQQQDQHQNQNQHHHQHQRSSPLNKHHDDDIDADNIEDADGDVEDDLKKSLKAITGQSTPRKRTPSGCSSDSSPYGTERSARIRTSDWIEVGDNGKQVTLTSCHISLEDSGLEDEERMDEMSSSGVGDSWDSVKEAEQQKHVQQQQQQLQQQAKRARNVKRFLIERRRRQRRHQIILQNLKGDYLISIASAIIKHRRERRIKARPRNDQYWTLIKDPNNEELYFESMRMTKSSFMTLCGFIIPHLPKQKLHLTIPVPPQKQVAICLYKLASCAEYRVVGDVFGVHKSTVHKYFHIVLDAILKLTKEFIRFPNLEECLLISKRFEKISHIPNIIGAIDGSHIPILPPSKGYLDYINRKGWPSMVMQAVVDDKFRNVNIKFPGSVHDATVFKESGIFKNASQLIPAFATSINDVRTPLMLVGDPAYPLLQWLLKPYTGTLTRTEESFNCHLSSARVCVENAFGRLKGRWRCLSKRTDISTSVVPKVVVACAILHNFCEKQKERYYNSWNENEETKYLYPQPNDTTSAKVILGDCFNPKELRDNIKHYLEMNFPLRENKTC